MALSRPYVAKAVYDFDVDAGGTGDGKSLSQTETIPEGATIVGVVTNETTAVTGNTDLDIRVGTNEILTAIDFGNAPSTGLVVSGWTNAADAAISFVPVKLSTPGDINININSAAVTAGVVEICVEYYL